MNSRTGTDVNGKKGKGQTADSKTANGDGRTMNDRTAVFGLFCSFAIDTMIKEGGWGFGKTEFPNQ